MGPRTEHLVVSALALFGQFVGHRGLRRANEVVQWIPEKSAWLVTGGVALGGAALFLFLWCRMGLIQLADKCGIIDAKKYYQKFPGFR